MRRASIPKAPLGEQLKERKQIAGGVAAPPAPGAGLKASAAPSPLAAKADAVKQNAKDELPSKKPVKARRGSLKLAPAGSPAAGKPPLPPAAGAAKASVKGKAGPPPAVKATFVGTSCKRRSKSKEDGQCSSYP